MQRHRSEHTLYLRLPTRSDVANALPSLPLNFALAMRGRPIRTAVASLTDLAPQITQVSEVVLLLAASDVTLLRLAVPPLANTRLLAALPALIEEHVIGDTADCAIALGPERDGQRLIAVCEREWLLSWINNVRQLGARHLRLLPLSLCLPLPQTQISAALFEHARHYELAIRLSIDEGMGLIIAIDEINQLPEAVLQLLAQLVPDQPLQLSVPAAVLSVFHQSLPTQQNAHITLIEHDWHDWISASKQQPIDFAGVPGIQRARTVSWQAWRWPITLAAIFLVFNIAALQLDFLRLRRQGLQLREEIAGIYQHSFPNEIVALDPLAQMKQKITSIRQASGQLSPTDFLVLSAAVGETWARAGNAVQTIEYLDYRDGAITLKVKPNTTGALEATQSALADHNITLVPSPTDSTLWQISPLK